MIKGICLSIIFSLAFTTMIPHIGKVEGHKPKVYKVQMKASPT